MSATVLKNVRIVDPSRGLDEAGTIIVENGRIVAAVRMPATRAPEGAKSRTARASRCFRVWSMPASSSVSPAAEHRETIESAIHAAAAGGVTSVITMPDTDPVIDDVALVEFVQERRAIRPRQCLSGGRLTKGSTARK